MEGRLKLNKTKMKGGIMRHEQLINKEQQEQMKQGAKKSEGRMTSCSTKINKKEWKKKRC